MPVPQTPDSSWSIVIAPPGSSGPLPDYEPSSRSVPPGGTFEKSSAGLLPWIGVGVVGLVLYYLLR